jgi:hypothetical protein
MRSSTAASFCGTSGRNCAIGGTGSLRWAIILSSVFSYCEPLKGAWPVSSL